MKQAQKTQKTATVVKQEKPAIGKAQLLQEVAAFFQRHKSHIVIGLTCLALLASLGWIATGCRPPVPQIPETDIQSITVVIDNNYPPYSFLDAQGNLQGISIDQWKLWEVKTGIDVKVVGMDWADAVAAMEAGAAGAAGAAAGAAGEGAGTAAAAPL